MNNKCEQIKSLSEVLINLVSVSDNFISTNQAQVRGAIYSCLHLINFISDSQLPPKQQTNEQADTKQTQQDENALALDKPLPKEDEIEYFGFETAFKLLKDNHSNTVARECYGGRIMIYQDNEMFHTKINNYQLSVEDIMAKNWYAVGKVYNSLP